MRHTDKKIPTTVPAQVPHDWARLIRKLRWIGLEEKAKRLEMALSTLPQGSGRPKLAKAIEDPKSSRLLFREIRFPKELRALAGISPGDGVGAVDRPRTRS